MVIRKRQDSIAVKCADYLLVGLGFVLLLTESRRFRIAMSVFKYVLQEALFYK